MEPFRKWRKRRSPKVAELELQSEKVQQFLYELSWEVIDAFMEVQNDLRVGSSIKLRSLMGYSPMWGWVGEDNSRMITLQREVCERLRKKGYTIRPAPKVGEVTWYSS